MGNEGAEEAEALLSQEQAARKSKAQETVQVSKSKMYSIFATILVLFGLLIATTASDWFEYKNEVRVEQKVVNLESMMEAKVAPKLVNTEAAIDNLILEEVRTEEMERERRKEKKIRAKAKKDKREKYEKEAKAKIKFSVQLTDDQKHRLDARRKRKSGKAKIYNERSAKMQERADRQWAAHLKSMVPRDFILSEDLQATVDAYDGNLKPPEYCYVSPTGRKVKPREPDAQDKKNANLPPDVARKILRLGAADYPCLILHQDCFGKGPVGSKNFISYNKLYFKNSTLTREEKVARTPNFQKLKLGSCAIVGNADNMLSAKYGKEIDDHDFVARFNVVTKPYKEAVGTKAHGIFYKTNYKSDLKPSMFNFFPKYVPAELDPSNLPNRKPPLVYGMLNLHQWRFDLEQMFWTFLEEKNLTTVLETYGEPKLPHPTGGISRVRSMVALLRLGACDRLDIYGFSAGGGKYFEKRKVVSTAHHIQAENYVYRMWMATGVQGKVCLYGK